MSRSTGGRRGQTGNYNNEYGDNNYNDENIGYNDDFNTGGNFMNPFNDNFFTNPFGAMQRQMNAFQNAFSRMDEFMRTDFDKLPQGGQYYCSSTTTTTLPNGVVETKRHTRTNGQESKEHFRQLGDRRMVARYTKDLQSGKEDLRRDMYNIKEDEIDQFQRDFDQQQQDFYGRFGGANTLGGYGNQGTNNNYKSLTYDGKQSTKRSSKK